MLRAELEHPHPIPSLPIPARSIESPSQVLNSLPTKTWTKSLFFGEGGSSILSNNMKARMLRFPQMLLFPPSPALSWPSTLPFVTFPTAETSLSLLVPSSYSLAPRGGTFLSVSRFSSLLAKAGESTEQNPEESPKGVRSSLSVLSTKFLLLFCIWLCKFEYILH